MSDSEDDDEIQKPVKEQQSKQNCNPFLMPDAMASEIVVNNGQSDISGRWKKHQNSSWQR